METRENIQSYSNTVIEVNKIQNYIKSYNIRKIKDFFACIACCKLVISVITVRFVKVVVGFVWQARSGGASL